MASRLLIDTDVLIDYLRDYPEAVRYVEAQQERLLISVVTVAELYAGVREGEERSRLERFLRAFEIIPLDQRLAVQGGLYRRDYSKSHNVGLADALIAATAIQWQVPLVTLNRRHFPMLQDVIVPYHKAQPSPALNQAWSRRGDPRGSGLALGNQGRKLMNLTPSTFVQIEGTTIRYNVNNLAEAKIALKELKLKKKEFALMKREIAGRQKEIRATYTHEVRNRGSMVRGGGGFGKFLRVFQTASRDSKRAGLANDLAPLENEKK